MGVDCLARVWLKVSSGSLLLVSIASLGVGIYLEAKKGEGGIEKLQSYAWATKLFIIMGASMLIIAALGFLGSYLQDNMEYRRCVLFPFFLANQMLLMIFVGMLTAGVFMSDGDINHSYLLHQCQKGIIKCEETPDGYVLPESFKHTTQFVMSSSKVIGGGASVLTLLNSAAAFLAATASPADAEITINMLPILIAIMGFLMSLPWLTSLVNSVYYNTAAFYKKKGHKKRPSYGYGRTSDDYYDDYDYDSKYIDRYDKDEGKYDKNEDRDRDYYRRRRPAGQGRHSDEPPYDNWRRSDIYTDQGDSWDRSYKVLPGAEVEES